MVALMPLADAERPTLSISSMMLSQSGASLRGSSAAARPFGLVLAPSQGVIVVQVAHLPLRSPGIPVVVSNQVGADFGDVTEPPPYPRRFHAPESRISAP